MNPIDLNAVNHPENEPNLLLESQAQLELEEDPRLAAPEASNEATA